MTFTRFVIQTLKELAASLSPDEFCSVTVNSQEYMVYRYEGSLNNVDNAVVLLSYRKGSFGVASALKAFLCSDLSLSTEAILEHYTHRWKIETFFKQQKGYFGIDKFMLRSAKAIDR